MLKANNLTAKLFLIFVLSVCQQAKTWNDFLENKHNIQYLLLWQSIRAGIEEDGFTLSEYIGQGGYGGVFSATRKINNKDYPMAVKLMKVASSSEC